MLIPPLPFPLVPPSAIQFEDDGDDHGQVKNEDVLKGAESNLGCASIINKCVVASHSQPPTANRASERQRQRLRRPPQPAPEPHHPPQPAPEPRRSHCPSPPAARSRLACAQTRLLRALFLAPLFLWLLTPPTAPAAAAARSLTSRVMQRGGAGRRGSSYKVEFSAKQCRAARDNIVKTIYNHIFDYVVEKVNAHIGGPEGTNALPSVGLLEP